MRTASARLRVVTDDAPPPSPRVMPIRPGARNTRRGSTPPSARGFDRNWFRDALREAQITQQEIAKQLGVHKSRITDLFFGRSQMRPNEAALFAARLHVPYMEILRRAGIDVPENEPVTVPVVGWVAPDGRIWRDADDGPHPAIPVPPGVQLGAEAVRVATVGAGALNGAYLVYRPVESGIGAGGGRIFVVRCALGELAGRLRNGDAPGTFDVVSLDGTLIASGVTVESAAPVEWVRLV